MGRRSCSTSTCIGGDGTARIFAGDPEVRPVSLHRAADCRLRGAASRMDVDLAPRTDDRSYLTILDRTLAEVLPAARPDLVLDIAGSDPRQGDYLGRLAFAMRGSVRALRVFAARRHSRLPVVRVAGGGYGGIEKAAACHTPLFRALAATVNVARGRRSCPG